jgi:hypothetical protein
MSIRFRLLLIIGTLFYFPAFSNAQTRSIISNLANPAIGMSALFLEQAAPDLNTPGSTSPGFQEAEISIISTVDPLWTLAGNFTFDAGSGVAEEAYATTDSVPGIQFKIGEFRATFGKHGMLHTHAFPFIQAPLIMSNSIGEEGFKNAGLEAAWMSPLPWYCELTLGGYRQVEATPDHPLNFNGGAMGSIPYLAHLKNLFDVDDDTTMELGASDLTGMGDDSLHHAVYGADFTLRNVPLRQSNQRGWILQGEYIKKVSYNDAVYNQESDGWYASFQYRLSQEWWSGIRAEEAFNTVSDISDNPTDTYLSGHVQRASVNVAWLPSEFSELKLEYGLAQTANGGPSQVDNRVMLQFNYIIGFHPPHAY